MYKKKENKNVSRDKLGHKVGTVYINKENIETLGLKKRNKLKEGRRLENIEAKKTENTEDKKTENIEDKTIVKK